MTKLAKMWPDVWLNGAKCHAVARLRAPVNFAARGKNKSLEQKNEKESKLADLSMIFAISPESFIYRHGATILV